ncbi:MAG TPA: MFS transporter [Armatimonadota bacterium]|jgi:MFS family permease
MIDDRPITESPLAVLKNRNFALFWSGQLISLVGSWMQALAQTWVVMSLTHTAFALGIVNFVSALPPALLMLHGGVAADKMDKRRILIVTQCIFVAGAFTMAALVRSGRIQLWHVMAMAVALGFAVAFDLPANQALTPELVDRRHIPSAVQLNQAIFHGSRLIGPAIAGWLIGRFGSYSAFVANGISFIPVILTLLIVRPVRVVQGRPAGGALEAMREGLGYVKTRPRLKAMLLLTGLTTSIVFPNTVMLMPFYVKNVLHLGAAALGTTMSAGGGGAFLGSMALLIVPEDKRVSRIALGMIGLTGTLFGMAALPSLHLHAAANLAVACLGAAILGSAMASVGGLVATIIQQSVPDQLRGRVMSLQSLVFLGVLPFASLIVSKAADALTLPREMFVAAIVYALCGFALFGRVARED